MFYSIKFLVSFIDPNTLVAFTKLLYSSQLVLFQLANTVCVKTPACTFLHGFRFEPIGMNRSGI